MYRYVTFQILPVLGELFIRYYTVSMSMMSGLPGGCNPADVLFKLAHGRGITAPVFLQVSEQGPPHDKTFNCSCTFLEVTRISVFRSGRGFTPVCAGSVPECGPGQEQERGKECLCQELDHPAGPQHFATGEAGQEEGIKSERGWR